MIRRVRVIEMKEEEERLAALGIDATVLEGTSCYVHAVDPQLSEYEMDEIAFARFVHAWLRDGTR